MTDFSPLAKQLKEICDKEGTPTTEMGQNHIATTAKKFSQRALEAFKTAIWHFVKKIDTVDIDTLIDYLLTLLSYTSSDMRQIMDDDLALLHRNFAADITALLALLLEKKSILILKPHHCYGLWINCTKFCLLYVDVREYNGTLRTCSWILLQVARAAKYYSSVLSVEQMIEKIAAVLKKYLQSRDTGCKTSTLYDDLYINLLRIFNELLFEFGAGNWHSMRMRSRELCDLIGQSWAGTISLWQSRKFSNDLISSLNEQSKVIEALFIIHNPDCIVGFPPWLNSRALSNLIVDATVNCMNGLSVLQNSIYRMGQIQLLPDGIVSLFATVLALNIVRENGSFYFGNLILTQIRNKDELWCQLIEKLTVRWGHRLPLQIKSELLVNIIRLSHAVRRPIDETAVRGWTFRCATLNFILKASAKPANIPVNVILEILCYKPDFQRKSPETDISKLERCLMSVSAVHISETPCQATVKKYFIREMVDFAGSSLMELWRNVKLKSADSEILQRDQINLFFSVQNLLRYLHIYDAECDPVLKVLKVMSSDLPRIIRSDKLTGVDEWLLSVGGEGSWQAADKNKEDWTKDLSKTVDAVFEVMSNYVHEAVHKCSSFREAASTIEPFIQHGTSTEKRKFITLLRTVALADMLQGEDKSERKMNELVIAKMVLTYFPAEEWKICGVLFDDLTMLHKSLYCSVWLDQAGLAKFVVTDDLPDEFRANVIKNIYMPPLKHKIHLRILAFLISMGTPDLYKRLIRIFPTFDAIIDLFLEATTVCYEVQPASNNNFLPASQLKKLEDAQKISIKKQSFQRYVNGKEINTSHIMYLDILFRLQEKRLNELFGRSDFKKSFAAAVTMNLCDFFLKLRKLLRYCRPLGYEFLIIQALKNFLKCDLSACDISIKLFIIENCATLCSLAARSCLASARIENITCLLDGWFDLYNLLLELHCDLAMEKAYCVFDAFIDNPYCREKIMSRVNMEIFKKSHFRVKHLLEIFRNPAVASISYFARHIGSGCMRILASSALKVLSCSTFIVYVNNSFSDYSGQQTVVKEDWLSFAFALFPHLFTMVCNEGHDMSQFCMEVNYLLTNFPEKLIGNDFPLVVGIVACIRQARVNLASELGFKRLPFDLLKLSKVCLEINMAIAADYFYIATLIDRTVCACLYQTESLFTPDYDDLSDPLRPVMHSLNGSLGFFEIFDGKESTDESAQLFMEILTKMDDADSLRPLSLQIKNSIQCRMILAKSQCDWSRLAAFSPTTDLKYLRSLAFYYADLDIPPEFHKMASLACAELQKWDGSFLKIYSEENTGRQIHSILFARLNKQLELSQRLCDTALKIKCNEIAKSWIVSEDLLDDLRNCCEVSDLVVRNAPPVRGSILSCPWIVCKYGGARIPARTLTPIVVARAENLCKKNAYQLSLKIIEKYRKLMDTDMSVYREYDITKARALEKSGCEEAARLILSKICTANLNNGDYDNNFSELSLKASMLSAELDVKACRPDFAIKTLQTNVEKALGNGLENVLLVSKAYRMLGVQGKTLKIETLLEERRIQKEKASEEKELEQYRNDRNNLVLNLFLFQLKAITWILTALDSYLATLELDASAVDIPYRALSLFIKAKYNENLLEPLKLRLNRFQSRPWIPLINHLCSHFFDNAPLAPIIRQMILAALFDYPHHVLQHLLFYTNSTHAAANSQDRLHRVEDLLKEASTKDKSLRNPIEIMGKAFSLYAQFAASSVKTFQNKKYARSTASIADSVLLNEIQILRNVPIPAIEQPLTDDLSQLITFMKIESVVAVVDNEDLRQDSLVKQLFTVVNILLMDENKTFPLRTYHVVPINSSAGIIEFCLGTISLNNYICGADRKGGMHEKLYPLEMTAATACLKLSQALFSDFISIIFLINVKARGNQSNLVETYEGICKDIHPVFRHFFYDRFPDPFEWLCRIKDYTISLARWSIVGYVVGLGDRHLNNIMVEKETGRLVHIDLGMVFEFGKRNLLVPEQVPFRLTREMVDPILIEGVNGKFKTVAVDTLDCLRKNSQVFTTILSIAFKNYQEISLVLLHDALTKHRGENGDQFATLAICRLRDKLAGVENGIYVDSSQQVSHLIKEASDPENLARMFAGWMPFL
uniref:non-specific serine/threonine protein kinase n=1 Tax=Elaeophora elaphi TaxID=1147741 RepID=A0A158Q8F1_9BILA